MATIEGTNIPLSAWDEYWLSFSACRKCSAEEGKPCLDGRFVGKVYKKTAHPGRMDKEGRPWRR